MKLSTVHYLCWMSVALAAATSGEAWAVSVSKSELAKMEEQVEKQSIEHRKLQAQATQINLELTSVSREMIKAAKLIQNNEEKLSRMETQLEKLKADLKTAEEGFTEEDDNLIKMLSALQNPGIKTHRSPVCPTADPGRNYPQCHAAARNGALSGRKCGENPQRT